MIPYSTDPTALDLKSVIDRNVLVVTPDVIAVEAIAQMSGLATGTTPTLERPGASESCVLVVEQGQLVGILTERDVVRLSVQQQPLGDLTMAQVMTTPIVTLHEADFTDLSVAFNLLQQHRLHHLPILDDQDAVVGLVTHERLRQALNPLDFHHWADLVPVGIFRTDTAGHGVYHNDRWCQLAGLTPEASTGKGWEQAIHPEDRERVVREWYQGIQAQRPFQLEYRFQRSDGTVTWVYGQAVAQHNGQGQVIGFVGTLTDLSDRKRSEAALQKSEAHQRAIISAIPDLIVRMNREGVYLEALATPSFSIVGNLSSKIGFHVSEVLPLDIAQKLIVLIQLALETQTLQVYEQELVIEGKTQYEEVRIIPYGTDEVLVLVQDISDRKQTEQALAASEAKSRAILATLPDLLHHVRADGTILEHVSPYREFDFTSQSEDNTGRRLTEVVPEAIAKRQIHYLQKALQTGELQVFEQQIQVGDCLQDEEVRIIKSGADEALFVIRDISDRKRAERQLQKLIEGTAATIGEDFFPALVRSLAETLNVSHAIVTELGAEAEAEQTQKALHVLAFWGNGALHPTFSYPVANTPCEHVLEDGQFYCESLAQEQFPEDLDLVKMGAQSYLGVTLNDKQGNAIGHLCILHPLPIPDLKRAENLLRVFAARAAAELEREHATQALEQLNQALEQRVEARTAALKASEERWQLVLKGTKDGFWDWDLKTNRVFYSSRWKQIRGFREDEISDTPDECLSRIHPEDYDHVVAALRAHLLGNTEHFQAEYRVRCKDGSYRWILNRAQALRDESGQAIRVSGSGSDITNRKQAELELQESQRFIQKIADASPNILYIYDLQEQRNVYINREVATTLGYSPAEIQAMGSSLLETVMHPDDLKRILAHHELLLAAQDGEILECEYRMRHANGAWRWLYLRDAVFLRDASGKVKQAIGTAQDITVRKQAEAHLIVINQELAHSNQELARATRLKDEFLANVSHELRTPLNAILGMTEGLQEGVFGAVNAQHLKALSTVRRSATHLLELINDILDVAKIEAEAVELHCAPISLPILLEGSLAFIKQQAHQKNIQIALQLAPHLPQLYGDERRIRKVLINLLNNAVKFTPPDGHITLEATLLPPDLPTAPPESHFLRISVTDTGIGIAPEDIQKLFQPFIQIDSALNRQYAGTGLGLTLVKRLVELHGGKVGLTSTLGVGSCFTIDLPCFLSALPPGESPNPLSSSQSIAPLSPPVAPPRPGSPPLILLTEDNEANVSTISSYFQAKGYQIQLAKNGQEAIALAKAHQPSLILMDIQMPDMDGLEAIEQIRHDEALAKTPIIALTELTLDGDRERCIAAGANEYLSKPIRLKELSQTIATLLAPS